MAHLEIVFLCFIRDNLLEEICKWTNKEGQRMSGSLGDCFSLFFRDNLLEEICKWTNKEGQGVHVFSHNWKDTAVAELRKVIGTILLVGVYKSSNEDLSQLWHIEHGRPIFCKIISRNRFQNISHVCRFNDATARRSARSPDKFSPIRNVFKIWNKSLLDAYVSGPNLTIDEQLVTFGVVAHSASICHQNQENTASRSGQYATQHHITY